MRVKPIGRLHFLVQSRSDPETEYIVDLEPEYEAGGLPYFCSCPRFTLNTHQKWTVCHHLAAAADYVRKHYSQTRRPLGSDQKTGSTSAGPGESGSAQSGSGRRYTVDPRRRGASATPGR